MGEKRGLRTGCKAGFYLCAMQEDPRKKGRGTLFFLALVVRKVIPDLRSSAYVRKSGSIVNPKNEPGRFLPLFFSNSENGPTIFN